MSTKLLFYNKHIYVWGKKQQPYYNRQDQCSKDKKREKSMGITTTVLRITFIYQWYNSRAKITKRNELYAFDVYILSGSTSCHRLSIKQPLSPSSVHRAQSTHGFTSVHGHLFIFNKNTRKCTLYLYTELQKYIT